MEVLYDYSAYDSPKLGVFAITTNEYKLPGGWVLKEEVQTIIGETDDTYVYDLRKSSHGEWHGNKVVQLEYILPLGVHKSRLVKWIPVQQSLF